MSGFSRRKLGKTGLEVSPLGIGCGNGISGEDLRYAYEQGINYFFYSSDLHHFSYSKGSQALRELCGSGSVVRDKVVLATVSYVNDPEKIPAILVDQFSELGLDYIDVFHWGWVTDRYNLNNLLSPLNKLKCDQELIFGLKNLLQMQQKAEEINQELIASGLVRHVGASFHSRRAARQAIPLLDVLMLRYNLTHLGVEKDVFPYLIGDKQQDPGIVVFNVAHAMFELTQTARDFDYPPFSVPDCYRFALTHPAVDLVLTGPTNRYEVDSALAMLDKGPMSRDEYSFMRNSIASLSDIASVRGG